MIFRIGSICCYISSLPIAIAESEKTAVGMTIAQRVHGGDQFQWLATGGKYGARLGDPETIEPLRGRDVYIWPDNDAMQEWKQFISPIAAVAKKVFYADSIAKAENRSGKEKYDIWDYTLDELSGRGPARSKSKLSAATEDWRLRAGFMKEFLDRPSMSYEDQRALLISYTGHGLHPIDAKGVIDELARNHGFAIF